MSWFTRFLGLDNAVESTVKKTLQESFPFLPGTPANGTLDYPLCRPDADGFLPVGFYRNRSKQGDNPQAYLHDEDLRRAREQSRDLACSNEYARNGLVNRRNYIVGTGFKVTAESVSDDTANDALVQQVNDWLARYAAITKRCEKEKESVMRGDRDGECFLRLFKEDGLLQWRFVEPEHVGNFDGQTPFGIKTDPKDITKVIHYLVRYEDGGPVEEVPADEMIHVKLNTDSGIKRGLPFLYPVFGILRKIESTNMNMATNAAIMASIAMIRHRQFDLGTTVDTGNSTAADVQTSNPFNRGSSVDNYRVFRPGMILDADLQTEYEFPANQINLGGVVNVKQSLLQTAAAGMGLPEYMLTSDASNGNFASTQVAETPAIAGFLAMQHLWADVFGCGPYVDGADNGLTWKAIEFAVEGGVLPPNVLTDIRLNTEGPSIEVRDKAAETQRNQSLADAGIISRDQWAKKEGVHKAHKSDEEMQAAKDAEAKASQQHELALAGAKSAKLKEGWEEDLHPRDGDGKFATKGSDGGEGEKAKVKMSLEGVASYKDMTQEHAAMIAMQQERHPSVSMYYPVSPDDKLSMIPDVNKRIAIRNQNWWEPALDEHANYLRKITDHAREAAIGAKIRNTETGDTGEITGWSFERGSGKSIPLVKRESGDTLAIETPHLSGWEVLPSSAPQNTPLAAFSAVTGHEYASKMGETFARYFAKFDSLPEKEKAGIYRSNESPDRRSFQSELGAKVSYAGIYSGLTEDGMRKVLQILKPPA